MEKITRMLNMFSAVIMLMTGLYIQIGFSAVLSPVIRLIVAAVTLLYFFLRVEQYAGSIEQTSGDTGI